MTFPTGVDFRKYSDEELTTMLAEAGEASKHARKRGRVMGIVAAHRLEQMKEILLYEELAIWRRANGFDRVEADHRSLPPTPEQYHAGLRVEVNALKAAISMPIRGGPSWQEYKRNIIRKIEQGEVSDEDFAVIKLLVETRDRDAAQVTVTQVSTVQQCSSIPKTPEPPPDVCVNLENNEDEMDPGMEELTSSSASTGLNTPGQQESPPNEGVWETERITADSILTAGVDSSKEGSSPMESVDTRASQESTTTTVAGTSSIAATPSKRRLKTSSEENKQFDPGGRGEQAPPWKAAVPLPFFSGSDAGRLLVCLSGAELRGFLFFCFVYALFFFCFHKLSIYPGETYQQAERRGSWTPIKSLMYATGGQALSRLLPYLKMAMTSNARFDRSANGLR